MNPETFNRVYASIVKRETTYDGVYYTGVKTTGIVCRPSCRARTPKAENIKLFGSVDEAIGQGFRPCKRCRPETPGPLNPDGALAAKVDDLIVKRLDSRLTLRTMAELLSVSPYHLQRTYKRVTGISPADRLNREKLASAKRRLSDLSATIAEVGSGLGFQSASHFAVWFRREEGMTPSEYRGRPAPASQESDSAWVGEEEGGRS